MSTLKIADSQSVYSITSGKHLVGVKSKRTFFKRHRKKNLLIFLLSFAMAWLSVAVLYLTLSHPKLAEPIPVCDDESCMRIAASLKESMNTSIDPCDDFYKYVCGRWPEAHPSLDMSQEYSWFTDKDIKVTRRIRDLLLKNHTDEPNVPSSVHEAQRFFASCIALDARNKLGLSPLLDLLDELGLPQVPSLVTGETSDFVKQLAAVKRVLWTDVFFQVSVSADPRNNEKYVLWFDVPDMNNPFPSDKILEKRLKFLKQRSRSHRDIQGSDDNVDENPDDAEDDESFERIQKVYMSEVIKQMISNGTTDPPVCKSRGPFSLVAEDEVDGAVDRLYEMTKDLWSLSLKYGNQTTDDPEEDYQVDDSDYMYIDDLQRLTDEYVRSVNYSLEPKLQWRLFVDELLANVSTFDPRDKVFISNLDYLMDVALVIAAADNETLESTIWWTVVDYSASYSSQELRRIWLSYITELTGAGTSQSLSLYCAGIVNDLMGMAVSWMFFNPSFKTDGRTDNVREMLKNIKKSFDYFVNKADWMDSVTRSVTLEKNDRMKSLIGIPEWLYEDGELDSFYEGIELSESAFFDNMIKIIRLNSENFLKVLMANDDTEMYENWPCEPTEVNAMYTYQENSIAIPAGIMQFPFYDLGLDALNYGAIGTILGHELTHGFDNSGRQFDSAGNLKHWWTNETISRYTSRTACFVEQYGGYYVPEVNEYIDGRLTLSENIADNGGLREAYHAYKRYKSQKRPGRVLPGFDKFTHNQLFFLSYAHMWCESYTDQALRWMLVDSHCPGHVRLNMALRNFEQFASTWGCPLGSKMNPAKKCQLW